MIVVMKPGATQQQIDHIVELVHKLGLRSQVIVGTERTVIAALGEKRDGAKDCPTSFEGVAVVVPVRTAYRVASAGVRGGRAVIGVRRLKSGGGHLGSIAAPCSVESGQQILDVAHSVREAGAAGLRGGAV